MIKPVMYACLLSYLGEIMRKNHSVVFSFSRRGVLLFGQSALLRLI